MLVITIRFGASVGFLNHLEALSCGVKRKAAAIVAPKFALCVCCCLSPNYIRLVLHIYLFCNLITLS